MKIAHESPNSIFKQVQNLSDYDYCLSHLFLEDSNYKDLFLSASKEGRELMLDNSIFEGKSLPNDRYVQIINELKPTWVIVPDVLEDYISTVNNYKNFIKQYSPLLSKTVAVVQGKTLDELICCYKELNELKPDKIAISFDYSYYETATPRSTKLQSWCDGRQKLIDHLLNIGIINTNIPHHLLGCSLAKEFSYYKSKKYSFIDSVDTSNPVVSGLLGYKYEGVNGLIHKPAVKLYELINTEVTVEQNDLIIYNIKQFKKICG